MVPKFASGSSGKCRENKGDDMTKDSEDELRNAFFDLLAISSNEKSVREWGQNRVRSLEQSIASMEIQIHKRNQTIEELTETVESLQDFESAYEKLKSKTARESKKSVSASERLKSEEDLHQRRRRERMLDEVTLMLLPHGMDGWDSNIDGEREWGSGARDTAENICQGIIEFDAKRND